MLLDDIRAPPRRATEGIVSGAAEMGRAGFKLAGALHGRSRWLPSCVLPGTLFAGGRRLVASWIRAAGVSDDFRDIHFLRQSVGLRWQEVACTIYGQEGR